MDFTYALTAVGETVLTVLRDQGQDTEENTEKLNKLGEEFADRLNESKLPWHCRVVLLINLLMQYVKGHTIKIGGEKEARKHYAKENAREGKEI